MKLIYIAGPFRAATPWLVEQNIRLAEEAAFKVWSIGAFALCPHTNTRFFDQCGIGCEVFLLGTMEMLRRCDAVLVLPGHEKSRGTMAGIREAVLLEIPVFYALESLREWFWSVSIDPEYQMEEQE